MRKAKTGKKTRMYTEGWVEFADKRVAKMAANSLNLKNICKIIKK